MPLLRYSFYSQNVNIYLAPTADSRTTWLPTMQHIAMEGRCFVLSANQAVRQRELPGYVATDDADRESRDPEAFASRGGSCIIGPLGDILAGRCWEEYPKVLCATINMDEIVRGKFDLDVVGSYSRQVIYIKRRKKKYYVSPYLYDK